jgi:gamma-glutamylcysteine synthetase
MASKRPTEEQPVQSTPTIAQREYVTNLVSRMRDKFNSIVDVVEERGLVNGYGDALSPTGGILNQFSLAERKMDRLRNQVWKRLLQGQPINPGCFDSIKDEMAYLCFLWLMLEDEAAAS